MRLAQFTRLLTVLFLVGCLVNFPVIPKEAQARGGGGFHGGGGGGLHGGGGYGGGFGGGSFRPESHPQEFHPAGFRPGGEGWEPRPEPGPGPRPGPGPGPRPDPNWHRRPDNVNVVNVNGGGWGPYWGNGWGAAAAGAVAGLAIGAAIASLPSNAQPVVVNNYNYYYDGVNYYRPCYQGPDVNYCVVADPNQ